MKSVSKGSQICFAKICGTMAMGGLPLFQASTLNIMMMLRRRLRRLRVMSLDGCRIIVELPGSYGKLSLRSLSNACLRGRNRGLYRGMRAYQERMPPVKMAHDISETLCSQ